ncbi:MAG: hypothetical protein H6737_11250 [Alphaproteobacteria bacterium]|nr:hypothetical protein [Alphaproteobacteria bacterium]
MRDLQGPEFTRLPQATPPGVSAGLSFLPTRYLSVEIAGAATRDGPGVVVSVEVASGGRGRVGAAW